MQIFAFYLFASIMLIAAVMTVSSRNPVHSVLWLILAFFNAAGLMLLVGAEFIAMLLVIVYVGAVAVLFLFVVMMLNIDFAEMRAGFTRYLPFGLILGLVLAGEIIFGVATWSVVGMDLTARGAPTPDHVSNIQAMGEIIYSRYLLIFELAGFVLLVALIGAIVLTLRERKGVRGQNIARQNQRRPQDATRLVNQPTGQGVEL